MTLPLSMLQFSRSMSSSLYVKPPDNFRPFRQKKKQNKKQKTKQNKRDCSTLRCNLFVNERIAWLFWHAPQGTAVIFFFQTKSTNKRNEEPLDRKTCLGVQHTSSQTVNCWLFPLWSKYWLRSNFSFLVKEVVLANFKAIWTVGNIFFLLIDWYRR